jgi:CubicO group peptidase (beta-lactamase class C family)
MLFVGLLLTGCIYIPSPPSSAMPARQAYLVSQIDHLLDTQQDASQPGISILITKNGEILYNRSKGMSDINQGAPITADTTFDIASVAKSITAIAVMQLMERRRLSLDDSVLKWLPELPATWHGITIHHLLSHQSGIPDCCSDVLLDKFQEMDGVDNHKLLRRYIADDTLLFAPGTGAKYSNTNYVLLAEIIGKAAGMPYAQYLQENIFTPLGMRSTYVYGNDPPAGTSAALNYGRTTKIYGITYALTGPVGIFSTTSDLSAFATGLLTDKLVSRDTLRLMTSDQSNAKVDSSSLHYGYGWFVPVQGTGLSFFAHRGGTDGFVSLVRINYEKDVATIILGNGGDSTARIINAVFPIMRATYD